MNRFLPGRRPVIRWALTALTAGTTALLSGCGNLTAGGFGEAVVFVSGDAPDSQGASASPVSGVSASSPYLSGHDDQLEGEVEVEFLLYLETVGGGAISLADDPIRVRVDLRGRQEADAVQRVVPATLYTALIIVFTEIEAEVDSGLIINGVPVVGPIEVELDDVNLTVTKALDLLIDDGDRVELVLDLNAAAWLMAVDPTTATVDEQVFANIMSVVVR